MAKVSILMVAEKPSLADSISKLLANGARIETRRAVTPVHEWDGNFRGTPASFTMTAVTGHVYNIDFADEFRSWQTDPLKLFTAKIIKEPADKKSHIVRHLQNESKGIDYLILWLDCDKEGENICFEVIENTIRGMKTPAKGTKMDHVLRAKFSSITAVDIRKAFDTLTVPNENESKSVEARQELDLKLGVAFTRFQTKYFQGKYGNLDSSVISYGPCQSPTLGFCVERHDKIQSFKPETFYRLEAALIASSGESRKFAWKHGRIFDKKVIVAHQNDLVKEKWARITKISSERKTRQRPQALNTVEMLKHGSSALGISPNDCMAVAERLYTSGWISYPRTETSTYPPNFDIRSVLKSQSQSAEWGHICNDLLSEGFERPTGGRDVGDHPPITPMRLAEHGDLLGDSWRLYEFICRSFIGSILPNMKYLVTTVEAVVGEETFELSGIQVISSGFAAAMHWRLMSNERIPDYKEGEELAIEAIKITEGVTSPPEYLSESDLIDLMEKHAIGTDASMAVHISNICNRNYVTVSGASRRLIPTNLGIVLIHGYKMIDPDLSSSTMRADLEKSLNYIATGVATYEEVLAHFIDLFTRKFEYFTRKVKKMDLLFESTFSPIAMTTSKVFSKCGKCRRYMMYLSLKPQRLYCKNCDDVWALPQNGNIKLYREQKCPIDNFELVLFSTGSHGTGYPLCPCCYNVPPFEDIKKSGMRCVDCPHPTCPHGMFQNTVAACPQRDETTSACKNGTLMLDATSAPRFKLSCNSCNLVISFSDKVKGVTIVPEETCEDCDSAIVEVEFLEKENREPLSGCVLDNEEVIALLETRFAKRFGVRRGRGRGGGRGRRRGRGRGRGH